MDKKQKNLFVYLASTVLLAGSALAIALPLTLDNNNETTNDAPIVIPPRPNPAQDADLNSVVATVDADNTATITYTVTQGSEGGVMADTLVFEQASGPETVIETQQLWSLEEGETYTDTIEIDLHTFDQEYVYNVYLKDDSGNVIETAAPISFTSNPEPSEDAQFNISAHVDGDNKLQISYTIFQGTVEGELASKIVFEQTTGPETTIDEIDIPLNYQNPEETYSNTITVDLTEYSEDYEYNVYLQNDNGTTLDFSTISVTSIENPTEAGDTYKGMATPANAEMESSNAMFDEAMEDLTGSQANSQTYTYDGEYSTSAGVTATFDSSQDSDNEIIATGDILFDYDGTEEYTWATYDATLTDAEYVVGEDTYTVNSSFDYTVYESSNYKVFYVNEMNVNVDVETQEGTFTHGFVVDEMLNISGKNTTYYMNYTDISQAYYSTYETDGSIAYVDLMNDEVSYQEFVDDVWYGQSPENMIPDSLVWVLQYAWIESNYGNYWELISWRTAPYYEHEVVSYNQETWDDTNSTIIEDTVNGSKDTPVDNSLSNDVYEEYATPTNAVMETSTEKWEEADDANDDVSGNYNGTYSTSVGVEASFDASNPASIGAGDIVLDRTAIDADGEYGWATYEATLTDGVYTDSTYTYQTEAYYNYSTYYSKDYKVFYVTDLTLDIYATEVADPDNVAHHKVVVDELLQVEESVNPDYRFVYLDVTEAFYTDENGTEINVLKTLEQNEFDDIVEDIYGNANVPASISWLLYFAAITSFIDSQFFSIEEVLGSDDIYTSLTKDEFETTVFETFDIDALIDEANQVSVDNTLN